MSDNDIDHQSRSNYDHDSHHSSSVSDIDPEELSSDSSSSISFTHTEHNPTLSHIHTVLLILQGLSPEYPRPLKTQLPPELALKILSYANYHPRLSARRNQSVAYRANDFWSHTQDQISVAGAYLWLPFTLPELENEKAKVKAKWITFQMRSADQGWATFGGNGTYENSHTWFEVGILKPIQHEHQDRDKQSFDPKPEKWSLDEVYRTPEEGRTALKRIGWDLKEFEGKCTWKVHNNITAKAECTDYKVEWVRNVKTEVKDERAMGDGRGFLEMLEAGDRVILWARAEQQMWVNNVYGATIELGCEVHI